jgi:protoheme IX farnesyltransferase
LLDAAVVVLGGALAAGSANALNCYIDRDIDQVMRRTRSRPLAQHTVSPRAALIFGTVLGVVSVALFAALANLLAAALTLGAIGYYVVVYTMLLKRRTSQSTLWGGICGAAPVLIAWATVRGSVSWSAFLLFLVVFFWQPTHFWALAVKFKDDYRGLAAPGAVREPGRQLADGGRLGRGVAAGHRARVRGERGRARGPVPGRSAPDAPAGRPRR